MILIKVFGYSMCLRAALDTWTAASHRAKHLPQDLKHAENNLDSSNFPTNFSSVVHENPPQAPAGLTRAGGRKQNVGRVGVISIIILNSL